MVVPKVLRDILPAVVDAEVAQRFRIVSTDFPHCLLLNLRLLHC